MPENIGATARAMMNFGLKDLLLVAPRDGWPNKRAYELASHAAPVLDNAKLFATTQEAVAGFKRIYAATARNREMVKPVFTPDEGTKKIVDEALPTAILFGPERTGLTNEDVAIADSIITIPTSDLASLNIAQSVVVLAYQWFVNESNIGVSTQDNLNNKSPFVSKEELQGFFNHLESMLDNVDFWKVPEKKEKMWMNLQNIFTRNNLTEQEVRTLRGVIAELYRSKN